MVTEGKIDFEKLKTILGENVESSSEKYEFTWNGKSNALRQAYAPSSATLRPCKDKSKNWDSTENLYIEGDNLEVLKQLQKTYYGKVKIIYIDPPYNTGEDFVYRDDFKDSISNYIRQTNQENQSNPETFGRFHSDWCTMIYSRLLIAKNLLSEDGIIYMQIDGNEVHNLIKIADEIFGDINHINTITVNMSNMSGPKIQHAITGKRFPKIKEYILLYCKNANSYKLSIPKEPKLTWDNEYNIIIPEFKKEYLSAMSTNDLNKIKTIVDTCSVQSLNAFIKENNINDSLEWRLSNSYRIFASKPNTALLNIAKTMEFTAPLAVVTNKSGNLKLIKTDFNRSTKTARIELVNALINYSSYIGDHWTDIVTTGGIGQEGDVPFNNGKKPLKLLKRLIQSVDNSNNGIILDFFSGSATTAHAVMQLNAEDGGNRKFIMIQLPELCSKNSEAYKSGYKNICEIGESRLLKAGEKIKNDYLITHEKGTLFDNQSVKFNVDIGFKVFRLDSTNIIPWDNSNKYNEEGLISLVDVFKEDRTKEDILYEIMLKYGIFDKNVHEILVNKKTMFEIGNSFMIICVESSQHINDEDVLEIINLKPTVVVFNELCFLDDSAKINAEYNFSRYGIEVKCI